MWELLCCCYAHIQMTRHTAAQVIHVLCGHVDLLTTVIPRCGNSFELLHSLCDKSLVLPGSILTLLTI